jgi:hypothetical protein
MHVLSAINFPGLLDIRIRREGLLNKASHLLFIVGVPLDSFNNKAVGGATCLFCESSKPSSQFWR